VIIEGSLRFDPRKIGRIFRIDEVVFILITLKLDDALKKLEYLDYENLIIQALAHLRILLDTKS
jgi:hypothetical protein